MKRSDKFINSYPRNAKYFTGVHIGNFIIKDLIISRISKHGKPYKRWKCLCNCGNEFLVSNRQLERKRKSCGCLKTSGQFKSLCTEIVCMRKKLNHYKQSAKRRNLEWQLNEDQFLYLIKGTCFYCKSPPSNVYKKKDEAILFNGVDRVDSNLGYLIENCVSCCRFCNLAKSDVKLPLFLQWLERLKKL